MASFPDLTERLSDGTLELRPASEWDIPDILIAHQDDRDLYLRLGLEHPPSGAELGRAAERAPAEIAEGVRLELTILEPGEETCRGRIEVHEVRWDHQRAELGIWLAPQIRGRGVAPRALRLAAGWLFDACSFERLTLLTETGNQAMLRAAQSAGFVAEGTLRAYARMRERRVDVVSFSLLPSDLAGQ